MLSQFQESGVATFAGGGDSHRLKPGAHWQAPIEGQPYEHAHFARAGVVPQSRNDLEDRGVAEIELLDEGQHAGGVMGSPGILVTLLTE
ncbi:unnamed protein product [Sphagnum balticum]